MNTKAALDLLMKRLGNRTAPGLRVSCLEEMVVAQEQLEQAPELPWFLKSERVITSTEIGERRLALPPDFIREVEDFNLEISEDGVTYDDLGRENYDEVQVRIDRNAEPGKPDSYYFRGNYVILRPTPDKEYFVRWPTYYAKQDPPVDDIANENLWFKHVPDLVMAMAGAIVSGLHIKDPALVTQFLTMQKSAEDRLVRLITAKEEENRDRAMG